MFDDLASLALLLSIFIISFNRGFFTFPSLALAVVLVLILIYLYLNSFKINTQKFNVSLKYLFLVSYVLFLFNSNGIYQSVFLPSIIAGFLPILMLPLVFSLFILSEQKIANSRFYLLFIIMAIVLRILMLKASPTPTIDIFTLLKEAPIKLLEGKNPYTEAYSQVYPGFVTNNYSYWPYSFLLQIPFVLIFKDPRVILVFADVMSAILIFTTGKRSFTSILLSLIFLYRPNSLFMIEQSFLAPLFAVFSILVFNSILKSKNILAGIFLGIVSGIHHYYLLLFLFFYNFIKKSKPAILTFFFVFLPVITVFLVWNPAVFINKTIFFYLKSPGELKTIPVHMSLNINTPFFYLTGKDLPFWFTFLLLFFLSFAVFFKGRLIKNSSLAHRLERRVLFTVVFFYLFYLLFRQSFVYYYYYAGSMLIYWLNAKANQDKND